ncbi:hypothetical protein [Microtetraspora niveoalba]|uniref:hypothetical protein n=1 Tax=Microtetraspora niveoalba TaxID=46175 RepID=UPI00082EAC88|nr:hypothetical protein [Microtetraspora niveoalba]
MPHPGSDETSISHTSLNRQAGEFRDQGDALETALTRAMAGLRDLGNFWGGDDAGRTFAGTEEGKGYRAAVKEAAEHVAHVRDGYRAIGANLDAMALNIGGADWASVAALVTEIKGPEVAVPVTEAELR